MILSLILLVSRIHNIRDESAGQEAASAAIPHYTSGSSRSSSSRKKNLWLQQIEADILFKQRWEAKNRRRQNWLR